MGATRCQLSHQPIPGEQQEREDPRGLDITQALGEDAGGRDADRGPTYATAAAGRDVADDDLAVGEWVAAALDERPSEDRGVGAGVEVAVVHRDPCIAWVGGATL